MICYNLCIIWMYVHESCSHFLLFLAEGFTLPMSTFYDLYSFDLTPQSTKKNWIYITTYKGKNDICRCIFTREGPVFGNQEAVQIFIKYIYDIVLKISVLDINSQNWITGSCLKF